MIQECVYLNLAEAGIIILINKQYIVQSYLTSDKEQYLSCLAMKLGEQNTDRLSLLASEVKTLETCPPL